MNKKSKNSVQIDKVISSRIHVIRNQNVMLDWDLADLYGVETKRLKEQVKRNMNRFPSHFMFQLTKEENESLRSQNATLKRGGFSKYLPLAFTEHGVLMLSNILKSESAIQTILISGNKKARNAALQLQSKGFDVKAILSPTVAEGKERLRICLHTYNSDQEITTLVNELKSFI